MSEMVDPSGENRPDDMQQQVHLRARSALSEHFDSATIGRIIQATQEILLSKERIQTEYMAIGSRLAQIERMMVNQFETTSTTPAIARRRAAAALLEYCQRIFEMGRSSVYLHMSIYRRFMNDHRALTLFNHGELQVLVGREVSDQDVLMVMEEKERNQKLNRDDIRQLLKQARDAEERAIDANAQMENARDELAQSVAVQQDQAFEIKQLRQQVQQTTTDRDNQRTALTEAQVDLARSNGSVSKLQIAVDDLTQERDRLTEQLTAARGRVQTKEVEKEVPPAGYVSVEAALADVTSRLGAAQAELKDTHERIESAKSTIEKDAQAQAIINELMEHVEAMHSKIAHAQMRSLFDGASNAPLDAVVAAVGKLHAELRQSAGI